MSSTLASEDAWTSLVLTSAEQHPDTVCLEFAGTSLTFREFVDQARSLAARLDDTGIRSGDRVLLLADRGLVPSIGVLGAVLAGAVVVPVDPALPREQLRWRVTDAAVRAAVVDTANATDALLAELAVPTVEVVPGVVPAHDPVPAHRSAPGPENPAYVIYTSGSTGRPKGVEVAHGALATMTRVHGDLLFREGDGERRLDRVAFNNPISADAFFADLAALAAGRTGVVVDDATRRDPEAMADWLVHHRIDVLDATPTQVQSMLLAGRAEAVAGLGLLVLGGEAVSAQLWQRLRDIPGPRILNMYGPTECTVDVTWADLRADGERPVIGRAVPGTELFLADDRLRPVAAGEQGELLVAGAQLALGYLNNPEQTASRFVSYTPADGIPRRVYRTGDRASIDERGLLGFHGRLDEQVQVSGYRVELNEVTVALEAAPGVAQACVFPVTDALGATVLHAGVVLERSGAPLDAVEGHLREQLPAAARPRLHVVPQLPLGPTGKADRAAVRAMIDPSEPAGPVRAAATGLPATTADRLGALWQQVLGLESVGPRDSFFGLGGDSLTATKLTVQVRREFGVKVSVKAIFEADSLTDYASAVEALVTASG
ncbi:non-ribosomal peptide synthetase [Kitasatospora viridis]|uniref:Amino acid adenylation domain-containing protein n=1 Tax=Kitasatospora viridis TaxID=281105 RepID=A0A561UMY9_9ACTN|nr:non-ribosomal peptide synthetase [Kitasatospora viridis]TWG00731.1 amino acid adenylation domain-containing protein [Kitasatospora viridis]